jgi:hypothetical protein
MLLKCRETTILDDPGAEFDLHFGADPRDPDERLHAARIVNSILERLQQSTSLSEFYAQAVPDAKGDLRLLRDCAKRMNDVMELEKDKYDRFVKAILEVLDQGAVDLKSHESCNNAIWGLVKGKAEILRGRGVASPDLSDVDDRRYIYFGYVFERAVWYYQRGGGPIARNDYEDSSIIKHMRLTEPSVLVTNDGRTLDAVLAVMARLKALGFGIENNYHVQSRVIRTSEVRLEKAQ